MSILGDTYCQIFENFITEKQCKKRLYSGSHLHQEVYGYWPAYFLRRNLSKDDGSILEKDFWKMFFATRDT